jgi:transitional endoplasmic reticulum ATPase
MARELSPSIVLMEDLASQGGMDRREYGNGYVSSNLGLLLNVLEGVEENDGVITIATENYVDNLDIALRNRPGRFDIILHMPNPGFDQREQILANLLPEFPGGRIQALAHKSGGMSCAHLRELAIRLLLEDEPIDKDTGIIEDMIKTFGIEVVIEEKTPHTGEDHIVAAHISEE